MTNGGVRNIQTDNASTGNTIVRARACLGIFKERLGAIGVLALEASGVRDAEPVVSAGCCSPIYPSRTSSEERESESRRERVFEVCKPTIGVLIKPAGYTNEHRSVMRRCVPSAAQSHGASGARSLMYGSWKTASANGCDHHGHWKE